MIIKRSSGENSTAKYVAVGGQSARLQAVVAGKADGTLTDTLNALRGERAGQVKIVANAADYSPIKIAHSYAAVSQAALNDPKKRKALVAYTKAIIEGSRLIMSKPDLAAEAMYTRLKGDVDLPLLKMVVAKLNEQHAFTANGQMDPELHASTTKTYLGFKLITKTLPFEQAFDRTIEDEAMKELGATN
jgi:ABC-type nitrate/sulfonate/bicarbonate transport system substrate-binding protein